MTLIKRIVTDQRAAGTKTEECTGSGEPAEEDCGRAEERAGRSARLTCCHPQITPLIRREKLHNKTDIMNKYHEYRRETGLGRSSKCVIARRSITGRWRDSLEYASHRVSPHFFRSNPFWSKDENRFA
jgi:hypothetical protein